ncbi:uncharacterized protein LOC119068971 isoform X2 [Bradysia coprophila]|uniref:uncharacterized protein LOC119068971 isoform X2 n=1 Tax=Bradysia coprophila TaxID=38358 RepID=UPI00187DB8E8|nr:uncharacterized protein LOC119068971 isoform X2 [Bradysia coprophila]
MPKSNLQTFSTAFWKDYKEKRFYQIIENIPKLMEFECGPGNVDMYQKLCSFSLIVLVDKANDKTVAAETHMTTICNKYQTVIASTKYPITALQYFICLEYLCDLNDIPKKLLSQLVENLAAAVLNKITTWEHSWTDPDRTTLNRFIIVLVELESKLPSPTFTLAEEAIKFFSTITTDQRKTAYTEYLLTTLKLLKSYRDENVDSFGELVKIRSQSTNEKYIKDGAIMMSQIIRASTSLISKGSLAFKQKIVTILNGLYEIIRNKSLSACQYIFRKAFKADCCDRPITHAGLQILETVRTIVVEAIRGNNFNEILVSAMSNFAMAEEEIISNFDCAARKNLNWSLRETFRFILDNIDKIVTTCGLDRAKRTLQKCLTMNSLEGLNCVRTVDALSNICKDSDNIAEKISWAAFGFMFCTDRKNKIFYLCKLHELQSKLNDPKQFATITSLVKDLPKKKNSVDIDPIQLQLFQISVEIDYPRLSEMCLKKLGDDMCEMDFYKNGHSFNANLCKSGVCYVLFLAHMQQYKSNVKFERMDDPLNEKFVLLKKEVEIVGKLKEALDYLAEFIRDEDAWLGKKDSADYILLAEKFLLVIAETLINRHYKEQAVAAFELFYKFTKLIDHRVNQIIAAGYLVENIHLTSTVSEKEIVTELQSNIMQKLKDVNTMSEDELGSFLFGFLQLTMYTLRHQCNIEHTKKYMQSINKLLDKYDGTKAKYLPARLKYAEVMFELIVKNPDTTITPVTFIEDIFHRFKQIRMVSRSDYRTIPGIILDLLITLHEFTQPRYELCYTSSLNMTVHSVAIQKGYLFLLAKVTIVQSGEMLLINGKYLKTLMNQLDVLFDCPRPALPGPETEDETITWNKDISPLIHPIKCKCFQCTNKLMNTLMMDVATLKTLAVYFNKEYENSLALFKRIYNHWTALNTLSYSGMLMHYSDCLVSNHREDKSNAILNEALDVCNDYAQAQDISVRLLLNTTQDELKIEPIKSYADEVRPKVVRPKKKVNSKPSLPVAATAIKERITYPKRSNLRN